MNYEGLDHYELTSLMWMKIRDEEEYQSRVASALGADKKEKENNVKKLVMRFSDGSIGYVSPTSLRVTILEIEEPKEIQIVPLSMTLERHKVLEAIKNVAAIHIVSAVSFIRSLTGCSLYEAKTLCDLLNSGWDPKSDVVSIGYMATEGDEDNHSSEIF